MAALRPIPARPHVAAAGSLGAALALALLPACSNHPPADEPGHGQVHGAPDATSPQPEPPFVACPDLGPATATRAELQEFLDRGLPDLLARLHTAPVLDRQGPGARFVGFRLVALADDLRCGPFGLREGDVVTAVNGHGIERPEDALEVWQQLYEATTITLSLLRGGVAQEAVLTVVDEPVRIDNSGVSSVDAEP